MKREDKLNNITHIFDYLGSTCNNIGIDKSNFRKIYATISNIKDDEQFNHIYKLILTKINLIVNRLPKTNR